MDVYDHLEPGWAGWLPAAATTLLASMLMQPTVKDLQRLAESQTLLSSDPFGGAIDESPRSEHQRRLRAAWSAWPTDTVGDLLQTLVHVGLVRAERSLTGTRWSLHPTMKPEAVLRLTDAQCAAVRRTRHMIRHADVGLRVYDTLADNFARWPVVCTLEVLADAAGLEVPAVRHGLEWNITLLILSMSPRPMSCAPDAEIKVWARDRDFRAPVNGSLSG